MLGSYRRIFVAIAGLALLAGAQQPSQQGEAQDRRADAKSATDQAAAPAEVPKASYRPYPDKYAEACYEAPDHDQADLCAQWRAAIAAEKAAREARRATTWAIIATIISAFGITGLIITIWQTHGALAEARRGNRLNLLFERRSRREARKAGLDQERALAIAEQNASAASAHVQIAKDASERELRAYLSPENIMVTDFIAGKVPCFQFSPMNSGKTPAYDVVSSLVLMWMTGQSPHDAKVYFRRSMSDEPGSRAVISPKQVSTIDFVGAKRLGNDDYQAALAGNLIFVFAGILSYRDTFGKRHLSTFKTFLRPVLLSEEGAAILSCCRTGNVSN